MNNLNKRNGIMFVLGSVLLLAFFLLQLNWSSFKSMGLMYVLTNEEILSIRYGCETTKTNMFTSSKSCSGYVSFEFKYMALIPFSLMLLGIYGIVNPPKETNKTL